VVAVLACGTRCPDRSRIGIAPNCKNSAMKIGNDAVHFSALTYQELFTRMVSVVGAEHAGDMAYLRDRYINDSNASR